MPLQLIAFFLGIVTGAGTAVTYDRWHDNNRSRQEDEKVWAQCQASQMACDAVQEAIGARLTVTPWLPMTLTPVLDPR